MEEERSPERVPGSGPWEGSTRELASALRGLVARLRTDQDQRLPEGDPFLGSTSPLKRHLKSIIFRSTRPATRRYDRLSADLATVAADLASRLAEAEEETKKARGDYERLELTLRALAPAGTPSTESAVWSEIPDDNIWAFDLRKCGNSVLVEDSIISYE